MYVRSLLMKSRIKEIRESKGIKQVFLANQVGVKQQTLSDWESDRTLPKVTDAYKVADVLGVDVRDLYKEG